MKKIKLNKGNFTLSDRVVGFIEKEVTRYGNGAKVDCPKKYLGRRVYLLIPEDEPKSIGTRRKPK